MNDDRSDAKANDGKEEYTVIRHPDGTIEVYKNGERQSRGSSLLLARYIIDYYKPVYVYIGESFVERGHYKIGITNDANARSSALSIVMYHLIKCNNRGIATYIEKQLHLHYRAERKHISGEWFSLDPEDVEELKSYKTDQEFRDAEARERSSTEYWLVFSPGGEAEQQGSQNGDDS